jgi:hypothetical protein
LKKDWPSAKAGMAISAKLPANRGISNDSVLFTQKFFIQLSFISFPQKTA